MRISSLFNNFSLPCIVLCHHKDKTNLMIFVILYSQPKDLIYSSNQLQSCEMQNHSTHFNYIRSTIGIPSKLKLVFNVFAVNAANAKRLDFTCASTSDFKIGHDS